MVTRRDALGVLASSAALLVAGLGPAFAEEVDPWPDIKTALFGDRSIEDGAGLIELDAPARAYDAALVPVTVTAKIPQTAERSITSVHLIIDQNPAPLAGVFHFTTDSGRASFATRVRVDAYTNMRAVAETNDGRLYMAVRFVKAAGGCSAPMLKDMEQAMARLGRMKLKDASQGADAGLRQAQLLISHPNFSGMQFDQVSRNYIPPHYVESVRIQHAGRTIMTVDGNISLSEDPSIRFEYLPEPTGPISIEVKDSKGETFKQDWSAPAAAGS
jgi:sulfur-oxidizing protein SoxY